MTKIGAKLLHTLIMFCVVLSYTPLVFPQTTTTGAVEGRIHATGSSDKGMAGASVLVRNEESGLERSVTTNTAGDYFLGILPPGHYTITVAAAGFETQTIANFVVRVSKANVIIPPITLQTAAVSTSQPPKPEPPPEGKGTVVDSGSEQMTNTTDATKGQNFDRRILITLPLPGVRTFDRLAFLAPGVALPPQAIGNSYGPGIGAGVGTSGQFSVNGLRSRSNNFTIDGSDNNDEEIGVRRQGFTSLVPQSIESLQEFQIVTLLPEPQFGRNMGAQVNAVSRSGSNSYHGTLYGFYTSDRFNARDPFDLTGGPATFPLRREPVFALDNAPIFVNGQPLEPRNPVGGQDSYHRGQFGFTLGGPIVKQKTFLFLSFEHQNVSTSRESNFAVPTIAQRGFLDTGEVGGIVINGLGEVLAPLFPTSGFGDAFFSLFPFPNNPRGPFGRNTYTEILPASGKGSIASVKLDQQNIKVFDKDHVVTGRYNVTDDNTILPVTGEALFSSLRALVRTQNLSLSLNSAISSRTSNQFRFSWGRTSLGFEEVRNRFLSPSRLVPGEPFLLNAPILFNGTQPIIQNKRITGFDATHFESAGFTTEDFVGPLGQVIVSGFSPIGVDVFNFPQQRTNNTYQYADTLLFNVGKHRFTAGSDLRRVVAGSRLDRNFRPLAVFSGSAGLNSNLDSPLAGFLSGSTLVATGAPTGFFQTLTTGPDSTIEMQSWQSNFFFTDQIRLRPNFTLTVGVRYENDSVPSEVNRKIERTFNSLEVQRFEKLERDLTGQSGLERLLGGRKQIFNRDNNNIAPHLAFAWDPFGKGKTSIRAGYGIYYDQIPGAVISQSRNVFPSFLTVNTAGFQFRVGQTDNVLLPANPLTTLFGVKTGSPLQTLVVPGTLNRLNPELVNLLGGDLLNVLSFIQLFSASNGNGVGGPAFVLPASDLITPYSQHWGLTVEQEIGKDFLVSAAYVGTKGSHLLRFATPNLGPNAIPKIGLLTFFNPKLVNDPAIFEANAPLAQGKLTQPRGGRPFPLLGPVTTIESDANSIYHSLQFQASKRFSHGLQLTTAYTWSHAIDEVSDIFDLAGAPALPQDSFNRSAERGDANFDVRHRFIYSFIWDLPFFQGNQLLGGWELASIGSFQTGQPYTITQGFDVNQDGNLTDRLSNTAAVKQVHEGALRFTFDGALNPLPVGSDGLVGRNTFRAQGLAAVDMALNKHFTFAEHRSIEFRSEFFNVFNRYNFGIPIHQVGFPGFGQSVNLRVPPRTIQFALKYSF
jgi:hypothetical protein